MIKHYLAEDTIDHKDIDALVGWLKTYPRLTKAKLTLQFEERWGKWLGQKGWGGEQSDTRVYLDLFLIPERQFGG